MHMADALLSPAAAGAMYVLSGTAAAYSVAKLQKEEAPVQAPVMGVMGAFVFATQMVNFTIPGTGSSGHLCGGMMLSAVLGPEAGFLTMIGVLLIQCLCFADGGLLALGANVWNMAFYGCFLGSLLWRTVMKNGMSRSRITWVSILGCILTLQLGAFSVVLETLASGITALPFSVFAAMMQPIHLFIGLGEGLITAAVLLFIYETRPELLDSYDENRAVKEKRTGKQLSSRGAIALLAAGAALIAGVVSLFASSLPDGLEWSLERVTGSTELDAAGPVYEMLAGIQEKTAFLPDYNFAGSEAAVGVSVSGIVGGCIVVCFCVLICMMLKKLKNRQSV